MISIKFKIQGASTGTTEVAEDITGLGLAQAVVQVGQLQDDPTTLKLLFGGKRVDMATKLA
jgi:hypothetical protein